MSAVVIMFSWVSIWKFHSTRRSQAEWNIPCFHRWKYSLLSIARMQTSHCLFQIFRDKPSIEQTISTTHVGCILASTTMPFCTALKFCTVRCVLSSCNSQKGWDEYACDLQSSNQMTRICWERYVILGKTNWIILMVKGEVHVNIGPIKVFISLSDYRCSDHFYAQRLAATREQGSEINT